MNHSLSMINVFIENYVCQAYPGIIDPTSENAVISPAAEYHDGYLYLFLNDLKEATGDKKIAKFIAAYGYEDFEKEVNEERKLFAQTPHTECLHCNAVIWEEEAEYCPSCSNNPTKDEEEENDDKI